MPTHFTFFIDVAKTELDYVFNYIIKHKEHYLISKSIVCYEHFNEHGDVKPHIHIYNVYDHDTEHAAITAKKNLCKHFVEKYKLRVKGQGGKRKYGEGITKGLVRDIERACIYHTKEHNYKFFGWPDDYMQECESKSFKKESNNKLDYLKLLKDKILIVWEEKSYHYITTWSNDFEEKSCIYVGQSQKWARDYAEIIKKFVFNELMKEDKPIKSQQIIKNISLYITQYTKNTIVENNRYEIFMAI